MLIKHERVWRLLGFFLFTELYRSINIFQTELTIIKFNDKNLEDRPLKLGKQYLYSY